MVSGSFHGRLKTGRQGALITAEIIDSISSCFVALQRSDVIGTSQAVLLEHVDVTELF